MTKQKLTEQQREFLERFILDKSKRQKKKIENEFLDFERRKKSVIEQLDKLPIDHLRKKILQMELDRAQELASNGQFKQAYNSLKDTKQNALLAANGYLETISVESIREKIRVLDGVTTRVSSLADSLLNQGKLIIDGLLKHPQVSSYKTVKEQFEAAQRFIETERSILLDFAGLDGDRTGLLKSLSFNDIGAMVREIVHEIKVFSEVDPQSASLLKSSLAEAGKKCLREGKYIQAPWLKERFRQQEIELEQKLDQWKATDRMEAIDQAGILTREQKSLALAKLRYLKGTTSDSNVLLNRTDERKKVDLLPTFDMSGFMEEVYKERITKNLDEQQVTQIAEKAKLRMEEYLVTLKPNSDILFDLSLKTAKDLAIDLALANGIKTREPSKEFLMIAEQIHSAIMTKMPNEMESDGKTVTFDGKTYKNQKFLGKGAYGNVYRYEDDKDPPNFIVVKSLISATKRGDMVLELRNHRHAMGGESGEGHPNMIGMKGVAVDKSNGSLHMILENADGGDFLKVSRSLNTLFESGVISKENFDAILMNYLRQAAEGLKHVQDCNMTHHDIKPENYLVGSDGTLKIADFGSGAIADEKGEVSQFAVTSPLFKAPEMGGQKRATGKADTYTLGVMISKLNRSTEGFELHDSKNYKSEKTLTSLDRLQDAMLDPDPKKRPTIESVLLSSYMMDSYISLDPEKMKQLMEASLAYSKKVGSEIGEIREQILEKRVAMFNSRKLLEQLLPNGDPKVIEFERSKFPLWEREFKELNEKIESIHNREDVKPLLNAIRAIFDPNVTVEK